MQGTAFTLFYSGFQLQNCFNILKAADKDYDTEIVGADSNIELLLNPYQTQANLPQRLMEKLQKVQTEGGNLQFSQEPWLLQ